MTDLAPIERIDSPLTLFGDASPALVVAQATSIANVIAPLIRERNLYKRIGQSDHVFLEGWTLAGTMLGVFAVTVTSGPILDPEYIEVGYEATVEARTMMGAIVGRADAQCTRDENTKWRDAPSFQLRSMAITRASSKALRMPLGFVMKLAGYDTTPAEEMDAATARGETVTGGRDVRPGWKDIQEQNRAHTALNHDVAAEGLAEWVGQWLASKGYDVPLAKGQLNQLRRAIERELDERQDQQKHEDGQPAQAVVRPARAGAPTSAAGHSPPPAADQTSSRGRAEETPREGDRAVPSATTPRLDSPDGGDS